MTDWGQVAGSVVVTVTAVAEGVRRLHGHMDRVGRQVSGDLNRELRKLENEIRAARRDAASAKRDAADSRAAVVDLARLIGARQRRDQP